LDNASNHRDYANDQAPEDQPIKPDTKQLIHKSLLSFTRYFFPAVEKIHSSDNANEAALLARALCEAAPGGTRNDDGRAYMIAEPGSGVQWTAGEDGEKGTLQITGTVRGGCLSADRLVHIPGGGDYQLEGVGPFESLTEYTLMTRSYRPDHRSSQWQQDRTNKYQ